MIFVDTYLNTDALALAGYMVAYLSVSTVWLLMIDYIKKFAKMVDLKNDRS
jgi:hypothetical protein